MHRIGRTGRAGAEGEATSLVCVDEFDFLKGIERLIKRSLPRAILPGFEPDPNATPQPIQLRSQAHQNAPRGRGGQARPAQGKPSQPAARPGTTDGRPSQPRPKARPGGEVGGGRPGGTHRTGGRGR